MSTTAEKEQISQKLQQQYNIYQENIAELENQLSSVSMQINEHVIVENTLNGIPAEEKKNRKCFKMIGGVLVNKTVDEVLNILKEEVATLTEQRAKAEAELTKNRKELEKWKTSNHIKIIRGNQPV
ncbi:hypothetical protein G9P44_005093 [Scheffersomyces stipitis]|nr:hypothetical protein G9P44_005093 [Scheffersomyces stipitis]